jgi:uncharacterized protein (DUF1778 family)
MSDEAMILIDEDWQAFTRALNEPVEPNEKLKRLLASKSPWEDD